MIGPTAQLIVNNMAEVVASGAAHPFGILFFVLLCGIVFAFALGLVLLALHEIAGDRKERKAAQRAAAEHAELQRERERLHEKRVAAARQPEKAPPPPAVEPGALRSGGCAPGERRKEGTIRRRGPQ